LQPSTSDASSGVRNSFVLSSICLSVTRRPSLLRLSEITNLYRDDDRKSAQAQRDQSNAQQQIKYAAQGFNVEFSHCCFPLSVGCGIIRVKGGVFLKTVSRRTRDLYMRSFLNAVQHSGRSVVKPNNPLISSLQKRSDFSNVVSVLHGLDLLSVSYADNGQISKFTITASGICYFERRADERYKLIMNSIVLPVLVSIITTAVAVYILPSIGKQAQSWLDNRQAHTSVSLSPEPSAGLPAADALLDQIPSIPGTTTHL
jgi:hypothetical protein